MPSRKKGVRESRSEREQRRYNAVVKATYDSSLARELRGRSDEYIYQTYGIKSTRKVTRPKLQQIGREKVLRKRREWELTLQKRQYVMEQGLSPERAIELSSQSWTTITKKLITRTTPGQITDTLWKAWGEKKAYPKDIMQTVESANKWYAKKFPKGAVEVDSSSWGFAVAYYVHVHGYDFDMALQLMKPDKFDADIYEVMKQVPMA